MATKPTIILVHGAWSDAYHWENVILGLYAKGYKVRAVENSLKSLEEDIDNTIRLIGAHPEPVILVGHDYGGAVITRAGNEDNVVGLVYCAAYSLDESETINDVLTYRDPSPSARNFIDTLDDYIWIKYDKFKESYCQDVADDKAYVMSVTQKPIYAKTLNDPSGEAAWKNVPSWYQISSKDRIIPPETQKWLADRLEAKKVITLDSSHASIISHANDIVNLIDEAAKSLG